MSNQDGSIDIKDPPLFPEKETFNYNKFNRKLYRKQYQASDLEAANIYNFHNSTLI